MTLLSHAEHADGIVLFRKHQGKNRAAFRLRAHADPDKKRSRGFSSQIQAGLYLARKAAAPLLIRISVRSEPESGTVFTLVFPKQNDAVSMFSV